LERVIFFSYLRCSIEKWSIDLSSEEAEKIFKEINDKGVKVFRKQPGFIQYRLMLADAHTTVAVAEWASEELGKKGAENYRNWLRSSGIWSKLVLQTYDGEVVAASL
jgi:DNA gyrase inhibitor GyrI